MFNKIWKNIDKKRFKMVSILTIFFAVIVIIINLIGVTYSRYESSATMDTMARVAYFISDATTITDSIALDGLVPRNDPFVYEIDIKNFKNGRKANVNIKYNISIKTTTNLPLTYKLLYNETYSSSAHNIISSTNYIQEDDMYFKNMVVNDSYVLNYRNNQTDKFYLVVNFPIEYKNSPEYSGAVDLITIIIDAEQVV